MNGLPVHAEAEAVPRPKVRGLRRQVALLLGGGILCVYLALLLATTYFAQRELTVSADERQQLELELRAAALSYFYAERRIDLANLRRSPVIAAFFANRDLGMSMEYGLRTSLLSIRDAARRLLDERRVGEHPVYTRIVLLDADGRRLMDTLEGAGDDPSPLLRHPDGSADVRLIVDSANHPSDVVVQAPVMHRDHLRGTLLAWIDEQLALNDLIGLGAGSAKTEHYRILRPGQSLPPAEQPKEAGQIQVKGTPFRLVDLARVSGASDLLTSRWFLVGLVVIAVALLAGGALLLRFHSQNLVLHTRMEVEHLQRLRLSRQNARLLREIERREESERRLIYQTNYDVLTGLPNRALALDRLAQSLKRAARQGQELILFYLDLDHFKRINDSLGHEAGDAVLCQVAEAMKGILAEGDTLARLAADEFLFIFPDPGASGEIDVLAQRILQLFEAPLAIKGREIPLSACLGCAVGGQDGDTADELLQHADLAMKQAKAIGQGSYCTYQKGLDQRVKESLEIASLLRGAAERDELQLLFQPLVDLRTGKTVAAEALLRWSSAELGAVSPARFIPVAEESGLIRKLGAWILESACRSAAEWQRIAPCRVAVNVSSIQLQSPDEFRASVEHALAVSGLPPILLELEITEGVLLADRADIADLLEGLDRMGVHLSLDDFGTGYSALSYLRRFPFRVLKIDRSFITGVPDVPEDVELTRAIVAMAQALGLTVLAEGVERVEQIELLAAAGCDLAQGYYYSRPVSLDAFKGLIGLDADRCASA